MSPDGPAPTDAGEPRRAAPLDGVLVLDLGQVYNGPYCGWLLAQLGARVIKVESPTGDIVRARTRDPRGPYSYLMLNSDKESIVLNLKTEQGREVFLDLAAHADVLIENFSVGVMDRLGLDWETLRRRNPRLVHGSGTAFGLTGPYARLSAMDLTVQAMSGLINATGFADGPPVKSAAAVADFLGAVHLCVGVLAALLERERSGLGQRVESSMHEAALISLCSSISALVDGAGAVPERTGNRHPALSVAPYNVYEAADGFVAINCPSQGHWTALAEAMGQPELVADERFQGPMERTESMGELDEIVEAWTCQQPRNALVAQLSAAQIPCAPVLSLSEVLEDQHLWARGALVTVDDPERGPLQLPTSPVRMHGQSPKGPPRPAPNLGQHTAAVLAEVLGLDETRLAELREVGCW